MAVISQAKLPSDEHHGTLMMINQHRFREWLGAVRHQAITWTNVDLDPCRHVASQGHNELMAFSWFLDHAEKGLSTFYCHVPKTLSRLFLISQRGWVLRIGGLLQDCCISSVLAMEVLQSCIKPQTANSFSTCLRSCMTQIFLYLYQNL